jgi:hypothetical protein
MNSELIGIVAGLAILLIVFLICRAIVLWYWKIDRVVDLLERIEEHLSKLSPDETDK